MAVAENPCTPNALLDNFPCFQCLSEKELLAVLVLALATGNGNDLSTDLDALMQNSACNACMTDKQMLEAVTALFANYYLTEGFTIADIRDDIKCLLCVDPKRLKAMLTYLICQLFQPVT